MIIALRERRFWRKLGLRARSGQNPAYKLIRHFLFFSITYQTSSHDCDVGVPGSSSRRQPLVAVISNFPHVDLVEGEN
jgi:hypothetical protein